MRILWVMQHAGFVRYFESAIDVLASRGHEVILALEEPRNKLDERWAADALAARVPGLALIDIPPTRRNHTIAVARSLRAIRDTLKYQTAEYNEAPEMRERSERFVPPSILVLIHLARRLGGWAVAALDHACAYIDLATPPPAETRAFVTDVAPDVVVATPYVNFGSDQAEFLREATALRIPTAAAIASWDNLTTKGRMAWVPDLVIAWNQAQAAEAWRLHGVPDDGRVAVCGATVFDHWFGWVPSRSRAEFCEMLGFDLSRPVVLYLGSSQFLAPQEAEFVSEWLAAMSRSSDPSLATASVLIRPHPTNTRQWNSAGIEQFERVRVWPTQPQNPSTDAFRRDFYDSLFHCNAIVGVNTSAQIEAAILRRPVLGTPVVQQTRFGARTLHFAHLAGGTDPLLWTALDWPGHFSLLATVLADPDIAVERSDRFIQRFVRPHGRQVSAGATVADAVEALAARTAASGMEAPHMGSILRGTLTVPGVVLVWLFDNQGVPVWKRVLLGVFSGVIALGAIGYRIRDWVRHVAQSLRDGMRWPRWRWHRRVGKWRKRVTRTAERAGHKVLRVSASMSYESGQLGKKGLRRLRKTLAGRRKAVGRALRTLRMWIFRS